MDALLDPIMQSPELPRFLAELNEAWADETRRRERFHDEIREDQKAEFINGEVIVHSPVACEHEEVSGNMYDLLRNYVLVHGLGHVAHEKLLVSFPRNDYEPDICYFDAEQHSEFRRGQRQFPVPRLIVEVLSPSTEARDRGVKKHDYAEHGVTEYWIVDPDAETIEQYVLQDGSYRLAAKQADSAFASVAIPGFRMPVRAAFDDAAGLAALRDVIAQ